MSEVEFFWSLPQDTQLEAIKLLLFTEKVAINPKTNQVMIDRELIGCKTVSRSSLRGFNDKDINIYVDTYEALMKRYDCEDENNMPLCVSRIREAQIDFYARKILKKIKNLL